MLETLLNLTESGPILTEVIGVKCFCKWLQYLSVIQQFRKSILFACERILLLQKAIETDVLSLFIQEAKNIFEHDFVAEDNNIFGEILTGITVNTPEVLRVMNYLLNQIADKPEADLMTFVKDTETLQGHLNELSRCYMEMLEYASMLLNTNIIQNSEQLQAKLKTLTKVILQYYWFLSSLRDINTDPNQPKSKKNKGYSKLLRGASSADVRPSMLEGTCSLLKPESSNFHQTLTQWFKKFKELVRLHLRGAYP